MYVTAPHVADAADIAAAILCPTVRDIDMAGISPC
jgi:hypothetical protein